MTVLSRMYNKSMVDRVKEGKNFVYMNKKQKDAELSDMLEKIKNSIFDGNSMQMVNYLIDNSMDINMEDLETIGKLINLKKREMEENP
jgi:predicted transcriptional regulator